ncbi:MAG: 30S ribosomal protein S6 [Flavobacteriaceae bacterium]|nr:30S ribosomal protein S6 [Flavobacteriaceae bacterium]
MQHYETVFILNPVLSESLIEETVRKYQQYIISNEGEIVDFENWGLKKLAYPINKKKSGFYHLIEFRSEGNLVSNLEIQFRRDEKVLRYLTVKLDKYALAWSEKRRMKRQENIKTKSEDQKESENRVEKQTQVEV